MKAIIPRGDHFERRLGATVVWAAVWFSAGVAVVWTMLLPFGWLIAFARDEPVTILWPILNAATAAPFVWACRRCARAARAYAVELRDGRALVRWFAAFYLLGTLWTGVAVPVWGLIMPVLYAPMFLGGLLAVLLAIRLGRALLDYTRSRRPISSRRRDGLDL